MESLKGQEGVAKAVEAGKSAFVGHELAGKTLGVIGLGAIGGMVANAAISLGMNVMGYDPYITAKSAWSLAPSVRQASDYNEIFQKCDYITLHVPATPQTKNMICEKSIAKYALPREYEYRDNLPKTLVGKVAYRELEKEEEAKATK